MAEPVLSALLQVVFERLASVLEIKIFRYKGIHSQLKKWKKKLPLIRALLNDASQKEVTDEAVKQWLIDLQHLAYDIDDFLDDLATDAYMHHEFSNVSDHGIIISKIRNLIPTCCTNFSLHNNRMYYKLGSITTRLQELIDEKNSLGLIEKDGGLKSKNRYQQTCLVDAPGIVGREGDKKELLEKLLADEPKFSIVPIVGMGGIGKTTIARLLYDDKEVKDRFELKAWVCVSDDFDSFNISKVIFQSIGGDKNEKFADLNLLQAALKNQLIGKRFLLVLDDIWSEKLEEWETLVAPFFEVAPGSKIIITTRKTELLRKLGHECPYNLQKLSPNDAFSLFARYAGINDFESYPMLRLHGEGIVKKCDGLPLALKALGSSLRGKTDEEEWKQLLNNEIWMLKDDGGILLALRISYHDLSACCKQLFAYCCLIPKDCVFEKKDLILWWMAEGFLHNFDTNKTMECLGEHFQELVSRSFFQRVHADESLFVMPHLMNDLATFVAGEFFSRLDIDVEKNVRREAFKKYRHMSFVCEEYMTYNKFKAFERANSLRTFLAMPNVVRGDSWQTFYLSSKILVDILPLLRLLRVLSLSNLEIVEVPECVGYMKHLRYLSLSRTSITCLPESVCNLYNLQTLILSSCYNLSTLPNSFLKLKNLRHFDIRDTLLWNMMPLRIREMKSLQTLSNKVVVVENNEFFISWLRNLKNLEAEINIKELHKVQSASYIDEVNLSQKRVGKLRMGWSNNVFDDSRNEKLENEVLDALKPHSDDLKDLVIESYGGKLFPNWIGDPSFLLLTSVWIGKCGNCMKLPPLGELPSLKKLVIRELNEVKVMGPEFLGRGIAFPKLESLRIAKMIGWKDWSTKNGAVGAVFPCLQELFIEECPNLVKVLLEALPSLRVLDLSGCGDGVLASLIQVASPVTKLSIKRISGLGDEVWRSVMNYLGSVEELNISNCDEIRYLWESEAEASKVLVNLRKLEVEDCSKLVSLGEKEEDGCNQLTSLRILELRGCENFERCNLPNNIQDLRIDCCDSIASVSFPTGGHKLKSLKIIGCEQLPKKEVLLDTSMPHVLNIVVLDGWENLNSINELTCFVHLTELTIEYCSSIESFPVADLPNLTLLKRLRIVKCKSMDVAFFGLWPPKLGLLQIGGLKKPISKLGLNNFPPSLVELQLWGGSAEEDDVTSGSQLSDLPPSLTTLELMDFKKLESVSVGLQHLISLQHLKIWHCPKMKDLPEELLPSLLSLEIGGGCTDELKEKTSRRGFYWPRISYIPYVDIQR